MKEAYPNHVQPPPNLMSARYALVALALLLISTSTLRVSASDFLGRFNDMVNDITQSIVDFINMLKESAITIGRVLSGALIAIGVVLWASDVFSYRGRKLIIGGIILMLLIELVS